MIEVTKNSFFVKGDPTFSISSDIVDTLTKMKYPAYIHKGGEYIGTVFMGIEYIICVYDFNPFIHISTRYIYSVSLDEVDTVALARKLVNRFNEQKRSTFTYSYNKDTNKMNVNLMFTNIWAKTLTDRDEYLRDCFISLLADCSDFCDVVEKICNN